MDSLTEYKTRDFPFACYLTSRGAIFLRLERTGERDTLFFVLGIPYEMDVNKALSFWGTTEAEMYKKILRAATLLKTELSRFYKIK